MPERRIKFGRVFFDRWAHHQVRVALALEDLDDLAGRFVVLAEPGAATMGQFHRVSSRNVETAMVLPDQSRCRGEVASDPAADAVRGLAPAEEIGKALTTQHHARGA